MECENATKQLVYIRGIKFQYTNLYINNLQGAKLNQRMKEICKTTQQSYNYPTPGWIQLSWDYYKLPDPRTKL